MEVSDMVVMQMRKNNVLHLVGIDPEKLQCLNRTAQKRPLSFCRHLGRETTVDYECPLIGLGYPKKVVHWHGPFVGVTANEMVAPLRIPGRVAKGKQLVFRQ